MGARIATLTGDHSGNSSQKEGTRPAGHKKYPDWPLRGLPTSRANRREMLCVYVQPATVNIGAEALHNHSAVTRVPEHCHNAGQQTSVFLLELL